MKTSGAPQAGNATKQYPAAGSSASRGDTVTVYFPPGTKSPVQPVGKASLAVTVTARDPDGKTVNAKGVTVRVYLGNEVKAQGVTDNTGTVHLTLEMRDGYRIWMSRGSIQKWWRNPNTGGDTLSLKNGDQRITTSLSP
jgi:hypothetical protein